MSTSFKFCLLAAVIAGLSGVTNAQNVQQEREAKVAADVKKMSTDDFWIYNDLEKAKQLAVESQKPLMIVFR